MRSWPAASCGVVAGSGRMGPGLRLWRIAARPPGPSARSVSTFDTGASQRWCCWQLLSLDYPSSITATCRDYRQWPRGSECRVAAGMLDACAVRLPQLVIQPDTAIRPSQPCRGPFSQGWSARRRDCRAGYRRPSATVPRRSVASRRAVSWVGSSCSARSRLASASSLRPRKYRVTPVLACTVGSSGARFACAR